MKKILSTCMAVLLSVMTIFADDAKVSLTINTTHTPEAYAQISTQVCNEGLTQCGQSLTLSAPVPEQADIEMSHWEYIGSTLVGFFMGNEMTFDFRCEVTTTIEGDKNYCFSHWSDKDGVVDNLSQEGTYSCSYTVKTSDIYTQNVTNKGGGLFSDKIISYTAKSHTLAANTLTAHWVQPKVKGATTTDFQTVTDPTQPVTDGRIVFTLEDDVNFSNYNLPGKVGNFEINTTADAAYSKGTFDFPIKYTPTGIAGTYSADIVLCSKYPTGEAANKCQTATISVTEEYTPDFNATDEYDFGNVAKGSSKTTAAGYLNLVKTNYAAQNGEWTAWIENDVKGAFSISDLIPDGEGKYHPTNGEPMVKFAPGISLEEGPCSAELHLKCTYTDKGDQSFTYNKVIPLLGNAYTLDIPLLQFGYDDIESHDFGTVVVGETPDFSTSMAMANITTPNFSWTNNGTSENIFKYQYSDGNLNIAVLPNAICGDYTTTILTASATSTSTSPGYEGVPVTDNITIRAQIRLAEPTLSAYGGMGQVTLSWNKVTGASHYVLTRGSDVILTTTDNTQTLYIDEGLSDGSYTYTIKAVYAANDTYNTTSTATATTGVPTLITITNANSTGLVTGTYEYNATQSYYPFMPVRDIDVTAAFANDGTPLFNKLYIFGLTTFTGGAYVAPGPQAIFNASGNVTGYTDHYRAPNTVTPCYIYTPLGNGYTLSETITNMNPDQEAKPIGAITADNQKLYFTGYCPFASNGTGSSQIGVIQVKGGANSKVDIYLDNLQLYPRAHSHNGYVPTKLSDAGDLIVEGNDLIELKLLEGVSKDLFIPTTASAFVFSSTSNSSPFYPSIHIRGNNKLEGNEGLLKADALGVVTQYAGVYCAPIHLHVDDHNKLTTLTIDDIWPTNSTATTTERTNGVLDLRPSHRVRPCIELGNEKCVVNFNGGQMYLKNTIQYVANYTANFAIGHRRYTRSAQWNGATISATIVGMGPFMSGGTVNFNDGTIYGDVIDNDSWTKYSMENNFYSKNDLKCPKNTRINGGTFYCDVYGCSTSESPGGSPTNKHGDRLVRYTTNATGSGNYGLAIIDFDNMASTLVCDEGEYAGKTLAQYYEDKNDMYGHNSLSAKEGKVSLMIPYVFTETEPKQDVPITNWVVPIPSIGASVSMASMQFGGVKEVPAGLTKYLMYMEADKYLSAALASDDYVAPNVGYGSGLKITYGGEMYQVVSNTSSYKISGAQYMFKPVRGDEWFVFCPPFDVTNVYVLESYPEDVLAEMDDVDAARDLQARSTLDLLIHLCAKMEYEKSALPFWSLYPLWFNDGNLISAGKRGAGLIPLKHFTGSNYAEANYYLQRSEGIWEFNENGFVADWKFVSGPEKVEHEEGVSYDVLMKKGELYSLNFPYMYSGYGDEHWDYWTGKYIVLEGLGEQIIWGSNYNESIIDNTDVDNVVIHRNPTFSKIEEEPGYYLVEQNFQYSEGLVEDIVNPGGCFIPASQRLVGSAQRLIKSIGLTTGSVTYEEDNSNDSTTTSTPTISGNRQMMVYTIEGGVGIIPVTAQQVSIYNAAGQLITSQYLTEEVQIPLPAGIYLISGEKEQAKAIVR